MILWEIMCKRSTGGRRQFKIFIRLYEDEEKCSLEKEPVTVKPAARVNNVPGAPIKDHTSYVLFQRCLYVFDIP